jgi:uncharacterized protein
MNGEISTTQPVAYLPFQPLIGLSSPHIQTLMACFSPSGTPPPSTQLIVPLEDNEDDLFCEVSTPHTWKPDNKTIILLHGLGGSHSSPYMVRFSRKLYSAGYRVIRVNMRSCGPGHTLARRPYHGGISSDVLTL